MLNIVSFKSFEVVIKKKSYFKKIIKLNKAKIVSTFFCCSRVNHLEQTKIIKLKVSLWLTGETFLRILRS